MAKGDAALVVEAFNGAIWPGEEPTLSDAWVAIYQVLMYFDPEVDLLHVNEVSALRKPAWAGRAQRAEQYISQALGVSSTKLRSLMDRMMELPRWKGRQRHNPVGHGFRILNAEVLRRWGNPELDYMEEEPALNWFPGIKMPGRSEHPKIDVFITKNGTPRAILSCKWGIRHDRISDPTNECQEYRAAAARRQIKPFEYYVISSEFDGARLEKVLEQPCVDGLIHTHIPLLRQLTAPDRQLWTYRNLYDLTEFAELTKSW